MNSGQLVEQGYREARSNLRATTARVTGADVGIRYDVQKDGASIFDTAHDLSETVQRLYDRRAADLVLHIDQTAIGSP